MWDLWWTKWHWGRFFSEYFGFPYQLHQLIHILIKDKTTPSCVTVEVFTTSILNTVTCFGPCRPSSEGTSILFGNHYYNGHLQFTCPVIILATGEKERKKGILRLRLSLR
jgi:hypothetical protein